MVALAATRAGAETLNRQIRQGLQQGGLIGPDRPVGDRHYAVGELVMVTRNDHSRGLLNGQRATVVAVRARSVALRVDGWDVSVPADWAGERLVPAYAMTVRKAQGLTVEVALVDASGLADRNVGYVALSRARDRTEIHHHGVDELADALADDPFTAVRRDWAQPGVELAARIARHHEQQLAVEQRPLWRARAPSRRADRSR